MKKTSIKHVSFVALLAAGMIACNNDPQPGEILNDSLTAVTTPQTTVPTEYPAAQSDDAKLVSDLVESMNGDIAIMKQGQAKATDKRVKDLVKKLESEHAKLSDELKTLAAKKSWTVPSSASSEDVKKESDLAKEDADDYQKELLSTLENKNETNIRKLENSKTTDPDLQAVAMKALPKLNALLANIESVQQAVN